MPDTTPNLGLKKPLGNENVSRAAYNENLDIIDASAARKTDLIAHQNAADPHPQYATDTDLAAHATENNVHGATSSSAAGMIVARDSFGRAQVSAPSAAADIARKDTIDNAVGTLSSLMTTAKTNIVAAVNELFQFVSDGKSAVAAAITGKGVPASGSDTFAQLVTKIGNILLATGNAVTGDVLNGKTFSNGSVNGATGTMTNNGAVTITPSASNQAIPAGYHNGSGSVPAVSVPAANVKAGTTIAGTTGTMPDRGAVSIAPSASTQAIAAGYHNGSGVVAAVSFTAGNVLTGTTIAGTPGTMPNNGTLGTITPTTSNQTIAAGYTSGGTVAGSANLAAGNIRNGVNIFGVIGNVIQATGSASSSSLYIGHTASNMSGPITGTMPDSSTHITPSASNQAIPAGYHNGSGVVFGDPDLSASNIRTGVNIFGVTGSLEPLQYVSGSGTVTNGGPGTFSFSASCAFSPKAWGITASPGNGAYNIRACFCGTGSFPGGSNSQTYTLINPNNTGGNSGWSSSYSAGTLSFNSFTNGTNAGTNYSVEWFAFG